VTATASQRKKSKSPEGNQKEVAIIGGGAAGLTCALRLSERGYAVTLYEKDEMLGGQLSSVKSGKNGMYHDVYTHLFPDWYVNFWRILEADLKIKREDAFEPRFSVKLLLDPSTNPRHSTNSAPKYVELKNPNTASNIVDNLLSGALPPPDMFLVGFVLLDLASQHFGPSILQQQTVNGFLYSRPYATTDCAELHNTILNEIWCTSSSDTSATAYRDFVQHSLGSRGLPFAWLLRDSLEEKLIRPWQESLKADCKIRKSTEITAIELGDDNEITLTLGDKTKTTHTNIVLAVPAPELANLVLTGRPGRRVVDRIPRFSELQRLRTARILVVTVFFKEKLPSIPPEHVGLTGSLGYLTFIDISQLWTSLSSVKDKHTVLILAASDSSAYPPTTNEEWAHLMLKELAHYLPAVKPGDRWGDANSNIDYSKSLPQDNHSHPLFQNDMNSEQIIPRPSYPDLLDNVFFAGDFCFNEVNMSTVEAAVLSGLHAARELQIKVEGKSDIEIERGNIPSTVQYSAAKLALLPLAYGATAWSAVNALMKDLSDGQPDISEEGLSPATTLTLIPLRYLADWIASLEALGVAVLSSGRGSDGAASTLEQRLRTAVRGVLSTIDHVCSLASGRPADRLRAADALRAASLAASERPMERPPGTDQTRRPAPAEGHRLLRGTGRYRKYGHVRRHRAKL
jgi:predicted NAD/FAD-dependent oxidoreductase